MLFLLWVMLKKQKTVTPKAIPNPSISQIYTKPPSSLFPKNIFQEKTTHPNILIQQTSSKKKQ